jgi:alpha-N-arabinofuranosidase
MKTFRQFVTFVLLASLTPAAAAAGQPFEIDPARTGPPISQYIYGQFIEHLGHCIYGGLWAEMLQDRKFGYAVTDNYDPWATKEDASWNSGPFRYLNASPWRAVGPPGTVSMDANQPFTGVHSPLIHLAGDGSPAGISQDGLALVKGKTYVGRVVLRGDPGAAPVTVQLTQDDGRILAQSVKKLSGQFQTFPLKFKAGSSSENATLAILSNGKGSFAIGAVSLMPSDNINGWRGDTLALVKQLDAPVYRWPGGNFVSGYNWRDGLGERDHRPPRANPAWTGMEPNDVGIDEFMQLMRMIGAEPYISVNTGLGSVQQAADEVEYFNGSRNTPMGRIRAANGHPQPYQVRYWAVGNEMFGTWQLGYMPIDQYIAKHNAVAAAMWKVDPSIQLVGVGDIGTRTGMGVWSDVMLRNCATSMNLISEHTYVKEQTNLLAHVEQLAQAIHRVAEAHRQYLHDIPGLAERRIRVVMDEWNYWYGPYIYGELGVQYHFKDTLGIAEGLHEYFRDSDIFFMANYAQTVNVIGAIKTSRTAAVFDTTALPLLLYRHHFGSIPILLPERDGHLDISAAWTADKKAITVAMVNPENNDRDLVIDWSGVTFKNHAQRWIIHNPDPQSFNEPGQTPSVAIVRSEVSTDGNNLTAPGLSVVLYRLDLR